ncbi:MAG: tail fiber domain-containing protein [Bacteroidota bacterium]|nr:tail fiber domain-containing protein [Bacteroidota bacterium]
MTIVSDERLKTIDGGYTKSLQDVLKLNTILFHYKIGNTLSLPSDEQYYGFSAQEVQKIYPEAVKTGKEGYLNFNMHPILVSFVNAFKEQQQQIEDQEKQLDDQKKIIDALLKRVEKLESK